MKIERYIESWTLPNCKPSWQKAFKYAKLMEQGVEFPPVKLFYNNEGQLIYNDGRNRVMAAKMVGIPLKVVIHKDSRKRRMFC